MHHATSRQLPLELLVSRRCRSLGLRFGNMKTVSFFGVALFGPWNHNHHIPNKAPTQFLTAEDGRFERSSPVAHYIRGRLSVSRLFVAVVAFGQAIGGLRSYSKQACVLCLNRYHFFLLRTDLQLQLSCTKRGGGNSRASHGVQHYVLTLIAP